MSGLLIPRLSGLAPGKISTVVEDTSGLPSGTVVTHDPPGADTTGVTISAGTGVAVTITNEYTNTPVLTGSVQITKVVAPNVPAGVVLPATFTSEVVCDDGTDVLVTMPGSGGLGTPIVHPQVNALCVLEETGIENFQRNRSSPTRWTAAHPARASRRSWSPVRLRPSTSRSRTT